MFIIIVVYVLVLFIHGFMELVVYALMNVELFLIIYLVIKETATIKKLWKNYEKNCGEQIIKKNKAKLNKKYIKLCNQMRKLNKKRYKIFKKFKTNSKPKIMITPSIYHDLNKMILTN